MPFTDISISSSTQRLPPIPEQAHAIVSDNDMDDFSISDALDAIFDESLSESLSKSASCSGVASIDFLSALPPPLPIDTASELSASSMPTLMHMRATPATLSPRSPALHFPLPDPPTKSRCCCLC